MINPNNIATQSANDNEIIVNGVSYRVSDERAIAIVRLCTNMTSPVKVHTTVPAAKKKSDSDFPTLKAEETVGFCTRNGRFVRYWDTDTYCPDKVKFGIKQSLIAAGAKWDNDVKAFGFKQVKDAKEFMKAQAQRNKQ